MPNRILIVTCDGDLHADIVVDKIKALGGDPFRIDLDQFPNIFDVDLSFDRCWDGVLIHRPTDERLALRDICAVWMRKKAAFSFRSESLSAQERAFANDETEHILFSFLYSLDCSWMSHPVALRSALWKGEQLQRAARLGFDVPKTTITSIRASLDRFRHRVGGEIIFKALSSPSLSADMVASQDRIVASLPTTRINASHWELLDAVEELPGLFQQYIEKSYELRVTVIGDRLFAARICSQDDVRTVTDYRNFSAEICYYAEELPSEIQKLCIDFVHSYGLTFGALDLIVTPKGDYVFLENNPVGQFLFVEQLVPEFDMTGALARWLVTAANSKVSRS